MAACVQCESYVFHATHQCSTYAVTPTEVTAVRKGLGMVVAICLAELFLGPFA